MGLIDFPLWGLFKYSALCILQMNVLENITKKRFLSLENESEEIKNGISN